MYPAPPPDWSDGPHNVVQATENEPLNPQATRTTASSQLMRTSENAEQIAAIQWSFRSFLPLRQFSGRVELSTRLFEFEVPILGTPCNPDFVRKCVLSTLPLSSMFGATAHPQLSLALPPSKVVRATPPARTKLCAALLLHTSPLRPLRRMPSVRPTL